MIVLAEVFLFFFSRRQFDNIKRVLKHAEEAQGSLMTAISSHFHLSGPLTKQVWMHAIKKLCQIAYIIVISSLHFISIVLYYCLMRFQYIALNPLWTKFFFSSFFGTWPKTGSFHLPTHRREAHRKFFWWSLLKIELKFWWKGTPVSSWALKG